jgi:hypothetical protein
MDVLSKLAHLLPVQSFELTSARSVPADPKPWLRIVPHLDGLSITLSVRPLGQHGPQLRPAEGAPTLLGQIDQENVQAERDLGKERELVAALLTRCPLLDAHRSRQLHFELVGADACLDFIAALRDLQSEVHAEWSEDNRLRLRGRGTRQALRGGVHSAGNFFLASGSLEVDAELSLSLQTRRVVLCTRARAAQFGTGREVAWYPPRRSRAARELSPEVVQVVVDGVQPMLGCHSKEVV